MKKIITVAVGAVLTAGTIGLAGPAQAGPTEPRNNTGYCVSDIFYGNQPNLVDGHVVPSQSPGPKKTDPMTGEVVPGNSIGDYNSGRVTGEKVNIPQACHAFFG